MENQTTFSFKWGSQQSHILEGLRSLAVGGVSSVFLTDVTLACEGEYIEAHRLVLSLCSTFFKDLFNQNERITDKANGVVILGHVSAKDLRYILQFMYQGSVEVPRGEVDGFFEAGNMLKVEGLVGSSRVGVGLSETVSLSQGAAGSKPCPASKKLNMSTKKVNIFQGNNVKQELCQGGALNDFEDDDVGGLMDDYGDDGGDFDFGDNNNGTFVGGDEAAAVTINPGPSTTTPKTENNMKKKPDKLKTDNSSSSEDDGNSSDSDSGSTEDYLDSPPRPKNANYQRRFHWELSTTFSNLEEAKAHVKSEKKWRLRNVKTVLEGKKYCYDCLVTRDCPSKMYFVDETTSVQMYETGLEHVHGDVKRQGISAEVKEKINQIWTSGVKRPKRIMWELKKQGVVEPTSKQVVSYVQYNLKRKRNKT